MLRIKLGALVFVAYALFAFACALFAVACALFAVACALFAFRLLLVAEWEKGLRRYRCPEPEGLVHAADRVVVATAQRRA